MSRPKTVQRKNSRILQRIASLGAMRKGPISTQFQKYRRTDGTSTKRGPYLMYTCKRKGKTVGKRLSQEEASVYQAQIDAVRQFQELCGEFVEGSQQLADMEASDATGGKKNSSNGSRPNRKPRRVAS